MANVVLKLREVMKALNHSVLWILFCLFSFCVLVGCGGSVNSSLPTLDLKASYPKKKMAIQDVAHVTYIAFETDTNCLFSKRPSCISEHYFVCNDSRTKTVLFFDRKGRFVSSFNRFGEGPEEYKSFTPLFYDEKKDELYGQVWYERTVKVYHRDGRFVRTIPFEEGYLDDACDVGGDWMLCFNSSRKQDTQVYLLSKTDTTGKKQMLYTIPVDQVISSMISIQTSPTTTYNVGEDTSPLLYTKGSFLINDLSRDTVYKLTDTYQLEPVFTRTPFIHSMDPAVWINYGPEIKNYLFLSSVERNYNFDTKEGFDEKYYVMDKSDRQIYMRDLYNTDYPKDEDFEPSSYDVISGCWTHIYSAEQLLEALGKGELSGPLKDIATGLKEDDNIVLMLID